MGERVIIPTPRYISKRNNVKRIYQQGVIYRILLSGKINEKMVFAAKFLKNKMKELYNLDFEIIQERALLLNGKLTDIVIYGDRDNCRRGDIVKLLSVKERETFNTLINREQGYVLISDKKSPALLYAKSDIGCLYAVSTAIQLFEGEGNKVKFPSVVIRDYPDFRYRGNNWNIWCESGGWSYDRGDGLKCYSERIIKKLDQSLMYKINFIYFDGIGWNKERFPGYGKMMRNLNKEARLRGIKLLFVGYGSSYGAGPKLYNGKIFKNRKSYPHGRQYKCLGSSPEGASRYHGTCLSNQALVKLKQEELEDFIRDVEPGAVYLHNLDVATIAQSQSGWQLRCEKCRKKWPNDDIGAEDGMAGAFAHFYDTLIDAVNRVRKPSPGYIAQRDCISILVSPGYSCSWENDRDWKKHLEYWTKVSSLMKNVNNVKFGLREQFYNHRRNQKRTLQMAESLKQGGKGHGLGVLSWYGADGFFNDYLFLGAPVLNSIFEGAEMILNSSGHAYQEPLQLLNAEYSWNTKSSIFYKESLPESYAKFCWVFHRYRDAKLRPDELFGEDGFIDLACEKLYGKDAGRIVGKIYKMIGKGGESPILYLWNTFLHYVPNSERPSMSYIPYGRLKGSWADNVPVNILRRRIKWLQKTARLTEEARTLLNLASTHPGLRASAQEDINWFLKSSTVAVMFLKIMLGYLTIYEKGQQLTRMKGKRNIRPLREEIVSLRRDMDDLDRHISSGFSFDILDYLGADIGLWKKLILFLKSELVAIEKTMRDGKRPEPVPPQWW